MGARTLKEAVSAAIRDWVANVATTHYIIGSCVGPAPYPGARPRPPARDRRRGPGADPRARGAAARPRDRLRRRRLERDRDVRPLRRRRATSRSSASRRRGRGSRPGATARPLTAGGRGGVLHGSFSAIMQDDEGQIAEAHSVSAGLDYPGAGPEHAWLRDTGRASYVAVTDADALAAFAGSPASRASSPRSSPPTRSPGRSRTRAASSTSICLSGRGDKDLAEAALARRRDRRPVSRRRADRRRVPRPRQARRAHALPDGRLPDARGSLAIGEAYADGGADLVELGVPYSDPLADGPGRPRRRHPRARRGATLDAVLGIGEALAARLPVVLMCYANSLRRGSRAVRRRPRRARDRRADRARPARGGAHDPRGLPRPRRRARARSSRRRRRRTAWPGSGRAPRASSTRSRSPARRGSGRPSAPGWPT